MEANSEVVQLPIRETSDRAAPVEKIVSVPRINHIITEDRNCGHSLQSSNACSPSPAVAVLALARRTGNAYHEDQN
ncbi:hypothetical protein PtA15_3A920 [Puccinia triticina]|uniref:Uncharacterized protein n=1 Tax=Puccinia triticina TaxID=208348 RepID=A0ABY7CEB1_9BASI|nr:uncharacterized protein PtA15_3A920 [Puccinia triticina]WAQ83549.1 hypothetical protein PtA15_3A920 [Puccinia triticina]WAR54380.1 hypothetical protein PtB15_3B894 [Puccinia triticina]